MKTTVDWGNLVIKNRAKSFGVSWSEDEAFAVFQLKIPAEYVRLGCLTMQNYQEMKAKAEEQEKREGEKPLSLQKKEQLIEKARNLNLQFAEDVKRNDLITLIRDELEKRSLINKSA